MLYARWMLKPQRLKSFRLYLGIEMGLFDYETSDPAGVVPLRRTRNGPEPFDVAL